MLRLIVPCLAANDKHLFRFFDWHGHDGFITEPIPVDLATVLSDLQSPVSLARSVSDDDYVLTAIYSDSYNWLLRYGITFSDDANLEDAWPTLDLTMAAGICESEATNLLRERWTGYIDEHVATTWFRNQYGG